MQASSSFLLRPRGVLFAILLFFVSTAPLVAQYWVEQSRSSLHGAVLDAVLAPNGDRYYTGVFEVSFQVGDFPLVSQGVAGSGVGFAGYVAKQGADGAWLWAYPLYGIVGNTALTALSTGELLLTAYVDSGTCSYRGTDLTTGVAETKLLRLAAADGTLLGVLGNYPTGGPLDGLSGDRHIVRQDTALVLLNEAGSAQLNEPAVSDSTVTVTYVGECSNGDVLVTLRYERGPCSFLGATYGAAGQPGSPDGDLVLMRVTGQGAVVCSVVGPSPQARWFAAAVVMDGAEVYFETVDAMQWAGVEVEDSTAVRFRLSEAGEYISHQVLDMEKGRMLRLTPLAGGGMLVGGITEANTRLGTFVAQPTGPAAPPYLALLSAAGEWQQVHYFTSAPGQLSGITGVSVVGGACLVTGAHNNAFALGGVPFPAPTQVSAAMMGFGVLFGKHCMANYLDTLVHASCAQPLGGIIGMQAIGGAAPYTWAWSDGATTAERTGLGPGMYLVDVEDAAGCSASAGAYVEGPLAQTMFDLFGIFMANSFRPGTETLVYARAIAPHCSPVDVHMRVVLDPRVTLVEGLVDGDTANGDTLFLALGPTAINLGPERYLTLRSDTTLQVGDTLCFQYTVTPLEGDTDPSNNVVDLCFPVVNSYDPNDKTVIPAGTGPEGAIDTSVHVLTYHIRFQNTGNAPAFDVFIDDTLDTDLDLSRLQVLDHSHPMLLEVRNDRVLCFRFDDINLPDSVNDEPNSHGYVRYSVPLRDGAGPGTVIRNTAHIFFDFNPAVVTNTTVNTIQQPLEVTVREHPGVDPPFTLAPVPVQHTLYIRAPAAALGSVAHLRDLAGRTVLTVPLAGQSTAVDVSGLSEGAYLVQVGMDTVRFVKVQ